jgi:two-component system OmpR family sensor kinase/two-component system sensor histidine kinase BaeS
MTAELERMDQQRRNLTADVAHELRTPLHIIQGNLEGILDGVYEPTEEHLSATLEETRLLARLVEDLRTLSLAEAGQLPLRRELVDVAELLADIETSFSGQIAAAGLTLSITLDEQLKAPPDGAMTLLGDVGRLNQVLSNLMVNALRHTQPGGSIHLQAAPSDEGVQIIVQDSGEGISPEALPHIFDRFWRGSRTDGVGGGLGLAIARQLTQAHNGQIRVESEVGQGTTFTLQLPLTETLSANE